jgi:PAS domain S-box-containing protein
MALISLQESEAQFRALFENSAVGIGLMGLDRVLLDMNPAACRMFGIPREEFIGKTSVQFTHPDDLQDSTQKFLDLLSGKIDHYVSERRFLRKNGDVFWTQISMSMVTHADGTPNYIVGMIADITAQKEAKARLAEQEADYLRTLQQRVGERTRELEESNARLQGEIEQRIKVEHELAAKAAEEAVAAERTRLARDLHDAVTQTLFSASLIAEVLPDIWEMDSEEAKKTTEELRQLTRGALAEMRTLLLELRPAALTQTRLPDLIKQLCEALIGRSRLPIQLKISGDGDLPPDVQIAFYRIAQESLNNVIKYARATTVSVDLSVSSASVHYIITDDGTGFDQSLIKPTSLGMRIMRERAEGIDADLRVHSEPGTGTIVEAFWTRSPARELESKEDE